MARRRIRVVLAWTVGALLAASCSDASAPETVSSSVPAATTTDEPFSSVTETSEFETSEPETPVTDAPEPDAAVETAFADGPLVDVCGDDIVVQASDFPDVGAGPVYALLGSAPIVDRGRNSVSAPLVRADGTVEATTLEVRSGGPAVGFESAVAVMARDESIGLALSSLAVAVRDRSVLATHSVVALTDRSRDAVIIDPATYPDVGDLPALRAQGIDIRHVTDAPVISFLIATGVLVPDQLVGGSDGLPASFVAADGALAQQGDLTIEPVLLPSLPQWGRPVTALLAAESGWRSIDDVLLADADAGRLSDECLGRFVRVVQQSIVAYVENPSPTNVVMSAVRSQLDPLTQLSPELFDSGTRLATDAGVFDIQGADAPGTIDTDGLDTFLDSLTSALQVDGVAVEDVVDARFVDPSISF